HERAKQFGTFTRQGLYRFLQFLQSLQEQTETARPSVGGPVENAVRIMSIHGSKGLEFPIVFVCDLGKKHNFADCYGDILVDRKAYVGLAVVDQQRQIRYPSLAQVVVQQRLQRQSLAEELRLLYVAMTRAKEHLVLIGTAREDAAEIWAKRWSDHQGPLSPDTVLSSRCLLDLIGPVAAMNPAAIQMQSWTQQEIDQFTLNAARRPELTPQQRRLADLQALDSPPPMLPEARAIIDRLCSQYKYQSF